MKYRFSKELHDKGWNLKQLAEYWEMSYSNAVAIARNPKRMHWNALHVLPYCEGHTHIIDAVIADHNQMDLHRDNDYLYYEEELRKAG